MRILRAVVPPPPRFLAVDCAEIPQSSVIGPELVGHEDVGPSMLFHCFPEEFQCCLFVLRLRDESFQDLALVIDGAPEVMSLAVDPQEISSRCHCQRLDFMPSILCFRISAANIGPKRCHQNRTASWLAPTPRSCSRSSTFLNESGKRT